MSKEMMSAMIAEATSRFTAAGGEIQKINGPERAAEWTHEVWMSSIEDNHFEPRVDRSVAPE